MEVPLMRLETPVLFLIFARPETTRMVFDAIRKAKPTKLYVAADGPRDSSAEAERCALSREIATHVDWDCEVQTLFREENLGCGKGPSTAISWFFENESEGIILEDDCVPSPSFFTFCAAMLERYRNDTRIMHIAGTNLEMPHLRDRQYSYGFSNFTYCWGWATWRRAWKLHDFDMSLYREIDSRNYLRGHYNSIYERDYFQYIFGRLYGGNRKNIWDYQWQFACRINSGLVVVPGCNLVVNIGLGEHATNTTHPRGIGHDLKSETMAWPLIHPDFIMVNKKREKRIFTMCFTSRKSRIKTMLKQLIPKAVFSRLKTIFSFAPVANGAKVMQHDGSLKY
jgi:hypothetical protein